MCRPPLPIARERREHIGSRKDFLLESFSRRLPSLSIAPAHRTRQTMLILESRDHPSHQMFSSPASREGSKGSSIWTLWNAPTLTFVVFVARPKEPYLEPVASLLTMLVSLVKVQGRFSMLQIEQVGLRTSKSQALPLQGVV